MSYDDFMYMTLNTPNVFPYQDQLKGRPATALEGEASHRG